MNFKEMVGHRLKVARAEARMTQEELSKASGVSVMTIARTEQGQSSPTFENAYRFAEALGCTPNDLCGWKEAI